MNINLVSSLLTLKRDLVIEFNYFTNENESLNRTKLKKNFWRS